MCLGIGMSITGRARPPWHHEALATTTVMVTGAASGVGRACAERMLEAGARVVAVDVDGPALDALVAAVADERLDAIVSDVATESGAQDAVAAAHTLAGSITAVVNNVGGASAPHALADTSVDVWDRDMALNVRSTFLMSRAALQHDSAGRLRSIVNVGASLGDRSSPHLAAYGAAKAAVHQLTRTLAVELGRDGIRVNCVSPGFTVTPASSRLVEPARRRATEHAVPLGRVAAAEEIADLVVFLTSDYASFVSGQTLTADGGLLCTTLRAPRGWPELVS